MWPFYTKECRREIDGILKAGGSLSAYLANGKRLEPREGSQAWRLEREIEKKFKVKHAVATNSGTSALHAGLAALGVRGKEVVTSPLTFSGTVAAILQAGGTPRFCDVDPHTFCLDPKEVKKHVTKKTAAILPVSLFGYRPSYHEMAEIGVPIIEDGCQAVGASRNGEVIQSCVAAQCVSFNGSKNVPSGEGGGVLFHDGRLAERARLLVNHGENFQAEEIGYNYRMQELVACLARHGLKDLEERNTHRQKLVFEFTGVRGLFEVDSSRLDYVFPIDESHAYYVVPFKVGVDRARFIKRCAKRGLPVQASYTTPLHHLKAFRKYAKGPLPVVDELHEKTLCLLTTLTPEKPIGYAKWCAKVIREALE